MVCYFQGILRVGVLIIKILMVDVMALNLILQTCYHSKAAKPFLKNSVTLLNFMFLKTLLDAICPCLV